MRKLVVFLLGLGVAAALLSPAFGSGASDGRKVLAASVLAPVQEPFTDPANAIRGVQGGGLPWELESANAALRADGRLHVEVEGLVLARRPPVPANLRGTNPIPQFKAIVSCMSSSGGAATIANVSSPLVPASGSGDAEIEASIELPSPCFAPIVFVTSPSGAWFAVSGVS